MISIDVVCRGCGAQTIQVVDKESRNDPQECPLCGDLADRAWSGFPLSVSTSKCSASIPDCAASGRFNGLRTIQEARKELAKTKAIVKRDPSSKNYEEVKRSRRDLKETQK